MSAPPPNVTKLLEDWADGDKEAFNQLFVLFLPDLRRIARKVLKGQSPDHELRTTALVNEVFIQLRSRKDAQYNDRAHFFAVSARIMRQILVDHFRSRNRDKRGGGAIQVPLAEVEQAKEKSDSNSIDLIALDNALNKLAATDPYRCRLIDLRFFLGLEIEETAEALEVSVSKVKRDLNTTRAWLYHELNGDK